MGSLNCRTSFVISVRGPGANAQKICGCYRYEHQNGGYGRDINLENVRYRWLRKARWYMAFPWTTECHEKKTMPKYKSFGDQHERERKMRMGRHSRSVRRRKETGENNISETEKAEIFKKELVITVKRSTEVKTDKLKSDLWSCQLRRSLVSLLSTVSALDVPWEGERKTQENGNSGSSYLLIKINFSLHSTMLFL